MGLCCHCSPAAILGPGLDPNSTPGEGQRKLLHDGLLCFAQVRIKLLMLDKNKTVIFYFILFFQEREQNNHKSTYCIPQQSIHLVEFTLSTTSTRGGKSAHVPLKIIYKVKIFTCNHCPYLSKFMPKVKTNGFPCHFKQTLPLHFQSKLFSV